jgi:hypothetical protein
MQPPPHSCNHHHLTVTAINILFIKQNLETKNRSSSPNYNNWKRFQVDSRAVDHMRARRGQPIIKNKNDRERERERVAF